MNPFATSRRSFCGTPNLRAAESQRRRQRLSARATVLGAPAAPVPQAASDLGLQAAVGGPVVAAPAQRLGQVFLVHPRVRGVVGVLVTLAVAQVLHQAGRGVADVQRHGLGGGRPLLRARLPVGPPRAPWVSRPYALEQ